MTTNWISLILHTPVRPGACEYDERPGGAGEGITQGILAKRPPVLLGGLAGGGKSTELGHAAFHYHVGPDRKTAPEARVPLPELGPVEAREWVLSQILPTAKFEPAPWAEVQTAQEKAST